MMLSICDLSKMCSCRADAVLFKQACPFFPRAAGRILPHRK